MEIRVPGAVRRFSEQYARDLQNGDLQRTLRKTNDARGNFFWVVGMILMIVGFSSVCIYESVGIVNQQILWVIITLIAIGFGVWLGMSSWRKWRMRKARYMQAKLDVEEGVVSQRLNDGLYYLSYQMIMRLNTVMEVQRQMAKIHRAQMAGVRLQVGAQELSPGARRDSLDRLHEKAEAFVQAVQNEFDSVAGMIENCRDAKDKPRLGLHFLLASIMSAGLKDTRLHVRLQAIAYEPEGTITQQFECMARWKFTSNLALMELDELLDACLFTEYMSKWGDSPPEWDPSITETAATK